MEQVLQTAICCVLYLPACVSDGSILSRTFSSASPHVLETGNGISILSIV